MSEIRWQLMTMNVSDLVPVPWNPREISEKDYAQLEHCLNIYGLIEKPIINADNTVIGGHQRLQILKNQGIKRIECWVPDRLLSLTEVKELNVRLNRNHGEFDYDLLANEFEMEDLFNFGFDEDELGLPKDATKSKQKYKISIEFTKLEDLESKVSEIYELCESVGAKVKVKM